MRDRYSILMKRYSFRYALIVILGCLTLPSCSNDDNNTPDSPTSEKRKINSVNQQTIDYESGNESWMTYFTKFSYNNDKIEGYEYTYSDEEDFIGKERYTYASSFIKVGDEEGTTTVTYFLENGLVTSATDRWNHTWNYLYDSEKHLVNIKEIWNEVVTSTYRIDWADDNITSYTESDNQVMKISYTNNPNSLAFLPIQGFTRGSDNRMIDNILCAEGYFGKLPNNLPSAISGKTDRGENYENKISYSDVDQKGYPKTMKLDYYYSSQLGYSEIYNFEWSK